METVGGRGSVYTVRYYAIVAVILIGHVADSLKNCLLGLFSGWLSYGLLQEPSRFINI